MQFSWKRAEKPIKEGGPGHPARQTQKKEEEPRVDASFNKKVPRKARRLGCSEPICNIQYTTIFLCPEIDLDPTLQGRRLEMWE